MIGSKRDQISWVVLGVSLAMCVLWLTFTCADEITVFVFRIQPRQPIYDMYYISRRTVAVLIGGMLLAGTIVSLAVWLRRLPTTGYSKSAFAYLVANMVGAALLVLVVRTSTTWATSSAWIWYGFIVVGVLLEFYSRRKKAANGPGQPPGKSQQPPSLPRA